MSIWRNVVQLLLTLSPTTVALKVSQRPLRRSARAFSECSQGSDINVPRFLRAAKAYCDLVSRFGRFAVPSAGEISRCIVKVEQAMAQHEDFKPIPPSGSGSVEATRANVRHATAVRAELRAVLWDAAVAGRLDGLNAQF